MSENKQEQYSEVLQKNGQLFQTDQPSLVLCKPKIMPLKSVTLLKLEEIQKKSKDILEEQKKE